MEIQLKLWGNIGYYLPGNRGSFSLRKAIQPGKTVQEAVEELDLPKKLYFLITVNGRVIEDEYVLKDGDEVSVFNPFSGG